MLTPLRSAVLALLLAFQLLLPACADASRPLGIGLNHHRGGILGGGQIGGVLAPTFDTSIGNGVDAAGFASLPLHAGASRYYVNASTGSDANTCTQAKVASTPKASLASAVSCVTGGNGDQVLVAEGTTYAVAIDHHIGLPGKSGFSAAYPTVIESYPPSDPTNEAKLGRASGSNRPVFTGVADSYFLTNGDTPTKFLAFRGLDINPGNVDGPGFGTLGAAAGAHEYILVENTRFQYTSVTHAESHSAALGRKYIFRNDSFHGQWSSSGNSQGIFTDWTDGLTVEDSAFYHVGYKENVARSTASNLGGPTILSHPIYEQDTGRNAVIRRNVFVQNAADCGRVKGDGLYINNLCLNSPIFADNGGGNNYVLDAPFGIYEEIAGNVNFGGGTIDGSAGGGWGPHFVNSKQGSAAHHNILARSVDSTTALGLLVDAKNEDITDPGVHNTWSPAPIPYANPAYADFYFNVVSSTWNASGSTKVEGLSGTTDLTKIHTSYTNNVWPDSTSGTNTNDGSVTYPNAYTVSTLLTAINPAYVDLATAQSDWISNPEQHGWRTGVALAGVGYGVSARALVDLKTDTQIAVGLPTTGMFIGTLDGSTLTASGLPTGVTIDSDGRTWRYDGTGSAGTVNSTITETNVGSHNTSLSWAVSARPVLSSLSITPGSTSASATVSTTIGGAGNTLLWEVSPDSASPDWSNIRIGLRADLTGNATATKFGSQAVSASGTQTISSITGLTASTAYYLHAAQLGPNENPSATLSASFTTTGSFATLDPANKASGITLTNGNLTATGSTAFSAVRATKSAAGKVYWEMTVNANADVNTAAVADSTISMSPAGYWEATGSTHYATWFTNHFNYNATNITVNSIAGTVGFALDVPNHKLYIRDSTGWLGGGDPVAGTGGLDITGIGSTIYAAWQGDGGDQATFNFGATSYTYTVPTGYGNMMIPLLALPGARRRRRAAKRRGSSAAWSRGASGSGAARLWRAASARLSRRRAA